jgi:hypothetical protein
LAIAGFLHTGLQLSYLGGILVSLLAEHDHYYSTARN